MRAVVAVAVLAVVLLMIWRSVWGLCRKEGLEWGTQTQLSDRTRKNLEKWCQSMTAGDIWQKYKGVRKYTQDTVTAICSVVGEQGKKAYQDAKASASASGGKLCPTGGKLCEDMALRQSGFVCEHSKNSERVKEGKPERCCKSGNKDCRDKGSSSRNVGTDSGNKLCPYGFPHGEERGPTKDYHCCSDPAKKNCVDWRTGRIMIRQTDPNNKRCSVSHPLGREGSGGYECCRAGWTQCIRGDDIIKAKQGRLGRPAGCPENYPHAGWDDQPGKCCRRLSRKGGARSPDFGRPYDCVDPKATNTGGGGDCSESWATCPSGKPYCYWGDKGSNKGKCCKATWSTDCKDPTTSGGGDKPPEPANSDANNNAAAAVPGKCGIGTDTGSHCEYKWPDSSIQKFSKIENKQECEKVTLYSLSDFKGESYEFTGRSLGSDNIVEVSSKLKQIGWNNRISSICIPDYYEVNMTLGENYEGTKLALGPGKHNLREYSDKKSDEGNPHTGKGIIVCRSISDSGDNDGCWRKSASSMAIRHKHKLIS
jgi:hypothetical protein